MGASCVTWGVGWIKTSVAALGIVGALACATPAPTLAQGVHIGPGGVGVDIGRPGWRERLSRLRLRARLPTTWLSDAAIKFSAYKPRFRGFFSSSTARFVFQYPQLGLRASRLGSEGESVLHSLCSIVSPAELLDMPPAGRRSSSRSTQYDRPGYNSTVYVLERGVCGGGIRTA